MTTLSTGSMLSIKGLSASRTEPAVVRVTLVIAAMLFLGLMLIAPLVIVFFEAFRHGLGKFAMSLSNPTAWAAIKLSLITVCVAVPLNLLFGIAASWLIAKHDFRGKNILITLIDMPFSISPVVAGMVLILLLGSYGLLGPWLTQSGIKVIFATPGIILATVFITFPFVARELIPLLQAQGREQEEAAVSLGARGWHVFWRVTLPNMKWGLIYGAILCNARALGEFGAVSVVSGHIRGVTNTMPLHVEILYNEYDFVGAFSVSALLMLMALATLVVKYILEWNVRQDMEHSKTMSHTE